MKHCVVTFNFNLSIHNFYEKYVLCHIYESVFSLVDMKFKKKEKRKTKEVISIMNKGKLHLLSFL